MSKYKEIIVNKAVFTDLDLEFPFYDENDNRNDVDTVHAHFSDTTVSMDINLLIKTLHDMKEKGTERVYIAQHSDHFGYYITGIKIEEIK